MSLDDIDALLERYLHLLDRYTTLRAELTASQATTSLALSRANFSAPRGIRYGQELYDEHMVATRRIDTATLIPTTTTTSATTTTTTTDGPTTTTTVAIKYIPESPNAAGPNPTTESEAPTPSDSESPSPNAGANGEPPKSSKGPIGPMSPIAAPKAKAKAHPNPTPSPTSVPKMFGILIPPSLREAQRYAVRSVEDLLPRLLAVDDEMRMVEIQVRRARKRAGKVAAGKVAAGKLVAAGKVAAGKDREMEREMESGTASAKNGSGRATAGLVVGG